MRNKKARAIIGLLVFPIISINAQQIALSGQVSIHNSKYNTGQIEYVKNAYVTAAYTKSDETDDLGIFMLEFVGIRDGTSLALKVEKDGLEIVNKRELGDVILGRKTPVKIFLAPKGEIARAQTELYNVNLKALTARHDQLIARLRQEGVESEAVLAALRGKLNLTIADRFEAEKILDEQLRSIISQLPEITQELASVNLDFATEMYRQAYEYFKAGDIEKVIETLDETKLDADTESALFKLMEIEKAIKNLGEAREFRTRRISKGIETNQLAAKAALKLNDYPLALTWYENALELLETNPKGKEAELADTYWEMAEVYRLSGDRPKELEYRRQSISVLESFRGASHLDFPQRCTDLSAAYYASHELDSAILYREKGLLVLKTRPSYSFDEIKSQEAILAGYYEQRGKTHQASGRIREAVADYEKVLVFSPDRKDLKRKVRKML